MSTESTESTQSTPMDISRAETIVGALIRLYFVHQGLADTPNARPDDVKFLREYTLRDLLDANDAVKAHNLVRTDGNVQMQCDDRLLAAIYTWLHYPPQHQTGDSIEPIFHVSRIALILLHARHDEKE